MARANRTCARCPRIIPPGSGSHCGACAAEARRESDARRGSSTARGYGKRHQSARRRVLARDPLCKACGKAWSTIADHHPRTRRELVALGLNADAPEYMRGLCKACHDKHTAESVGGWRSVHGDVAPTGHDDAE